MILAKGEASANGFPPPPRIRSQLITEKAGVGTVTRDGTREVSRGNR